MYIVQNLSGKKKLEILKINKMIEEELNDIEDWQFVQYRMKEEGFHYCFKHYSNFNEIKDVEFHKLRLKYLKSAELLENYINKKCE